MKFVFNGGDAKDKTTDYLGFDWVIGQPVEVEDEAKIANLDRHPHFDNVDSISAKIAELRHEAEVHSSVDAFSDHAMEAEADDVGDAPVELSALSDEELEALAAPEAEPVKRRGRKPGSKNKPKDAE